MTFKAYPVKDLIEYAKNSWDSLPQEILRRYEEGEIIFRSDGININSKIGKITATTESTLFFSSPGIMYIGGPL